MALSRVVLLLSVGGCLALDDTLGASAVSQRCLKDTQTFLRDMRRGNPKEYAVLMYDAFGKMGSNVEGGNTNQPGLLQECRSARGENFSGKYCQVFLKQGTIQYFVGLCVPDSCLEKEVQLLVLHDRLQFDQTSLVPPFPSILVNESTQELLMTHCVSDTVDPGASDIACLLACCVMVALPLTATALTAVLKWQRSGAVSPDVETSRLGAVCDLYGTLRTNDSSSRDAESTGAPEEPDKNCSGPRFPRSCLHRTLEAFSLQTASRGLLSTSAPRGYSSLNGIRVFSLLWIICGHSALFPVPNNLDNYKNWKVTAGTNALHVFTISGPVFLAVDTFLLLGGLLSARSLLNSINRAEDKLSPGVVAHYLLKRLKRIQPLHVFIMCLTISLFSLVHWGPFWFPFFDSLMNCKTYWWANLLLVSNFVPAHDTCIPWTWYLSLDFQCYATTPLLVFLYRLHRRVFAAVAGGLLLMTTVASLVITALCHLPVFQLSTLTSENYVLYYYVKPYTRYGPFLIGILTGIFLTTKEVELIKSKWQAALGWFASLTVMAAVVGLPFVLSDTPAYPSMPHALYQGLHRSGWALCVTWIVLACEDGYGGFINRLLSWGVWTPLSNVSFACYLVHPIFIILYFGLQETPFHYTDINFMYLFMGNVVLTLVVSSVLTVLIERPYILLQWRRT